jgi:cytochrome c553
MKRVLLRVSLVSLLAPSANAALPGDSAAGKRLHDAHCTGCHDAGLYARNDRLVRSLGALKQQLQACSHAARRRFSATETQNIIKYLNDEFYRFGAESGSSLAPVPAPQERRAAGREQTKALYETARKLASRTEREKRYAALLESAAGEGDFELATDIAGSMSSVAARDDSYDRIVHRAILARDFPAADRAARKMSSAALRDEQFKRITEACPSTAITQ